jgi:predicted transcriptional regulator
MKQVIRELKRQAAGENLAPEQLKGLIRAGYVYRHGDEYRLTDMGRNALAQPGVLPEGGSLAERPDPQTS